MVQSFVTEADTGLYVVFVHGEFEVLVTPTEWVKVHAPQKFLQQSVDPHT